MDVAAVAMEGLGEHNGDEPELPPPDSQPLLSQQPQHPEDAPQEVEVELEKVEKEAPDVIEEVEKEGPYVIEEVEKEVPDEIPASQPRPPSETGKEEKGHHMLDELQEKILSRAEQDAALGLGGKGRKRKGEAKAKASPKAKGKAKAKAKGKAAAKKPNKVDEEEKPTRKRKAQDKPSGDSQPENPKPRRQRKGKANKDGPSPLFQVSPKDPVRRVLFPDDSTSPPALKKPAAKAKAKARKEQKEVVVTPKAKAKSKSKAAPKKDEETKKVTTHPKIKLPAFTHSTIAPYWSRNAVALKVPGGNGKNGLTQAGY